MKQFTYKKFLAFSSFALMFSMLFLQCRKNEDVTINEPFQPVYISGGIYGNVVNNNGDPEPNVKVSNGTNSVVTDQNGVFILKDQLLDKAGAQIKFEKSGYYTIYKSVIPIKNKMVFIKLQLVPKAITKIINSVTGDVVVTNGSAQVSISSNSIVDASGNLYSGQVQVYTYWMDPSLEQTALQMPGNLSGRDKDGKEVVLQTLGMMAVELEDLAGNPLNIATGKFAELKLPIPSSLDAQAKSSIPLWYYNATKGGWIEEGVATRQGNFYIGQVQHFSFWNCDYPFTAVTLKGRVLDDQNRPIGNAILEATDISTGRKGYGITTSDGFFEGKVPASASFTMTIGVDQCQTSSSINFTTSTIDLDLGEIKTNLTSVRIFGKIVDCFNNPVTNGYLQVFNQDSIFQSIFYSVDANGSFDGNILTCLNSDFIFKAVDLNNLKQSDPTTVHYQNQTEIDLGITTVCEALKDIFIVYVNNNRREYIGWPVDATLQFVGSSKLDSFSNIRIYLNFLDLKKPVQPEAFIYYEINPSTNYTYSCSACDDLRVVVNEFGPPGTQVTGTFYGIVNNLSSGMMDTLNGEFSLLRE